MKTGIAGSSGCPHTKVEKQVLAMVAPTTGEREKARKAVEEATRLLDAVLKELGVKDYEVRVEGSYAKDTWLSGELDIDLFILLPRSKCLDLIHAGLIDQIEEKLAKLGLRTERRYAQHPYARVLVHSYWVEVVPACRVEKPGEVVTAVDRTPLHTRYILGRLEPHQRDEVRLLKSFLKGIGVYGAEIAVEGFSGYLAELLIAAYGCFRNVIAEAAKWKPPVIVDVNGAGYSRKELLEKFGDKPMIVVDPVDPSRNAAAAVSTRSLAELVLAAKMYLREPRMEFFHVARTPPTTPQQAVASSGERVSNMVLLLLEPPQRVPPDTLWGVGKRALRLAVNLLERWGFHVIDYRVTACTEGRILACIELEERVTPPYTLHRGPPAWSGHALRFLEKYATDPNAYGPWIDEEGRLVVIRARRYQDAIHLLRDRAWEWLPGSASGYKVEVHPLLQGLLERRIEECELECLASLAVKKPAWMRRLYHSQKP
ncbi:CCA tRNA nucleotidyltransferase [Hyperthermus butylicus]|uniref:CCA-adding enzyme n=1 Tax=Hyperthermus butylicus (strain DSM 5456 / JCM 9403 / PLM1-5) TaxID=415426 RepID=A2BIT6_HYPBU|nr:CCA tRNA nucleotidyltransferase [Hyperthermus butylicus]ABM79892.1 tRNA nucleotidyltransferase [Hyperthermus butylicus DSM 5456]